jgi:hypothetical protein
VVNDIVASNFVTFQEGSEYLIIGGVETFFTFHWLAHTFESGHRLACNSLLLAIRKLTLIPGISHWVYLPQLAGTMLLNQHPMVTALLLFPLIRLCDVVIRRTVESTPFLSSSLPPFFCWSNIVRSKRVMLETRKVF